MLLSLAFLQVKLRGMGMTVHEEDIQDDLRAVEVVTEVVGDTAVVNALGCIVYGVPASE